MRLHHVQVAMPPGEEQRAREFYADALGLTEVAKPPSLAGRGGCWFRAFDDETVVAEVHVGVEDPFTPAKKAHPAFVLDSRDQLDALGARVESLGHAVSWEERYSFEGYERFHTRDPFGNRVEVLTPA